jgi:hypothetical protein
MYGGSSYSGGGSRGYGVQPIYCSNPSPCSSSGSGYSGQSSSYGASSSGASQNFSYLSGWKTDSKMYAHSLETMVKDAPAKISAGVSSYLPNSAKGAYLFSRTQPSYFTAGDFLVPGSKARFVGDAAEIQEYIKEAFKATTTEEMPEDIIVSVLNDEEFKKAHRGHGKWSDGIMGFCVKNRVFARADQLDRLMLTIGHEIGHALTPTLKNAHDEEAKAFAFSIAWMNAIRERNIANIGGNIAQNPARNGLHDIAFDFVQRIIAAGTGAFEAFVQLAEGMLTITEQPILVEA